MAVRYSQFCALARAAELLGERWTLLIIRELLLGPKRFSDLSARLQPVSASTLSERLSRLEDVALVRRTYLEPPAASTVYELTEDGEALKPALFELIRWGARYLLPARPGDRREPDWLRLALAAYAPTTPTPAVACRLLVRDGGREAAIRVAGGPAGTSVTADRAPADVTIVAGMETALALMGGRVDAMDALEDGRIAVEGDLAALEAFPKLFAAAGGEAPATDS